VLAVAEARVFVERRLPEEMEPEEMTSTTWVVVYWYTVSLVIPTTYIFVPSVLKARPVGILSCEATEKETLSYDAVPTLKAVERVYWYTVSLVSPSIYIFVPSVLKARSYGVPSCEVTEKDPTAYSAFCNPYPTVLSLTSPTLSISPSTTSFLLGVVVPIPTLPPVVARYVALVVVSWVVEALVVVKREPSKVRVALEVSAVLPALV